jgi:hypothetical protein
MHAVAGQRPSSQTARGAAHDEGRVWGGGGCASHSHGRTHWHCEHTTPIHAPSFKHTARGLRRSSTQQDWGSSSAHGGFGRGAMHTPHTPLIPQNIQGRWLESNPSPHAPLHAPKRRLPPTCAQVRTCTMRDASWCTLPRLPLQPHSPRPPDSHTLVAWAGRVYVHSRARPPSRQPALSTMPPPPG